MPKFKTDVDLEQNQLVAPVLENRTQPPTSPVMGQMYFNTMLRTLFVFDGAIWNPLGDDLMEWMG